MIEPKVTEEVRALEGLDLEAVRQEWRRRYGPAPKLRSADLLVRLLAWRIQSEAAGDLDAETRAALFRMAMTSAPMSPRSIPQSGPAMKRDKSSTLMPVSAPVAAVSFIC